QEFAVREGKDVDRPDQRGSIMLLIECETVMRQVLDFFASGHKSANKRYYVDQAGKLEPNLDQRLNDIQLAKVAKRNIDSRIADRQRITGTSSYLDDAETLLKMPQDHRSGNCYEMACISAYFALKVYNVPQSHLYIGVLHHPGDHTFCL